MHYETSTSTFSSEESFEYFEHNVWNSMLCALCHFEIGKIMETLLEDASLGRCALTCHFSLDVLCERTLSLPVVNDQVSRRNWWPVQSYERNDSEDN